MAENEELSDELGGEFVEVALEDVQLTGVGDDAPIYLEEADSAAETPIKKKRGRPRNDDMPMGTRTVNTKEPATPNPPFSKFWSEAPSPNRKPQQGILWFNGLPEWTKKRFVVYVYRKWPVLVSTNDAVTGMKMDNSYIDVLPGESSFKTITDLLDKYGAGDYQCLYNDDLVDKRTVMTLNIREGWRDLRQNPPTDRRIDQVESVDLVDPANRSYAEYLRGKGKLPEQQMNREREADMAEATAVTQMTGMMGKVIEKAMDNNKRGSEDSSAVVTKTVEMMAEASKKAGEVVQQAYKSIEEQRAKQPDPMDTVGKVIELVKSLPGGSGGTDSTLIREVMESNRVLQGTIATMQAARAESLEKRLDQMMNGVANPQQQQAPNGGLDSLLGDVERVAKLKSILGATEGGGGGGASSWVEMLPDIMKGFSTILANGVAAYQTYVMAAQMRANPGYMPQNMPPTANPAASAPEPGDGDGGVGTDVALPAGAGGVPDNEGAQLIWFLQTIERPFTKYFLEGRGGMAFAELLVEDLHDRATYDGLVEHGAETMIQVLKNYPPTGKVVQGKDKLLAKFVGEFMAAGPELDKVEEGEPELA